MQNINLTNKNLIKILLFFLIISWLHQWLSLGSFASLGIFSFFTDCTTSDCIYDFSWIIANRNQVILLLFLNLLIFVFINKEKKNYI